jgi:hypothetical protein
VTDQADWDNQLTTIRGVLHDDHADIEVVVEARLQFLKEQEQYFGV